MGNSNGCCTGDRKVVPLENNNSTVTLERPSTSTSEYQPEGLTKERHCTDVIFLIVFTLFIIVFIILIAYCMSYGDIYRIVYGYDDCANICGIQNTPDPNLACKGANRKSEPYLLIRSSSGLEPTENTVHRTCVSSCDTLGGYKTFFNRCIPENAKRAVNSFFTKTGIANFFQESSEDLQMCWREILYLCAIAFVFSIIILFLFRFFAGFVIWLVLVGVMAGCVAGTIFLWLKWRYERELDKKENVNNNKTHYYFIYAIIATVITVIVFLLILVLRKRIQLVIQLFTEAGKAIASMPLLLFEPILTFVSLALLITMWIYFAIVIESAGELRVESNTSAKYVKNTTIRVTRWYNIFALFWFTQFVIGCQNMVIAGSVAIWFFTRNKSRLSSPIGTSFYNLVRYHLGTVSFGSLIIAIIKFIRLLFRIFEKATRNAQNSVTKCLYCACECCLLCLDKILQLLTTNAYIETAIGGTPFCTSGKRAFSILSNNALRVMAINSVGDFVLFLGKAFVVIITVLVGMEFIQEKEGVHRVWVPLTLAAIFAFLIAHTFITVYEMTIDTIFICFCEDCEQNDGINRPYFMSRGLMEFVQNSKKVLAIDNERGLTRSGNAWSNSSTKPLKTISR